MYERVVDDRILQVKTLGEALINKVLLDQVKVICYQKLVVYNVMGAALYVVPLKDTEDVPYSIIGFNYNTIDENGTSYIPLFPAEFQQEINQYSWYAGLMTGDRLIANDDNVRASEEFEQLIAMKAADGMKFYHMPSINTMEHPVLVPIMTGFPNISKPDKAGISVFRIDDRFQLVDLRIFKKKINREYQILYRIVDLYKDPDLLPYL
jgi:hypothetical protein